MGQPGGPKIGVEVGGPSWGGKLLTASSESYMVQLEI